MNKKTITLSLAALLLVGASSCTKDNDAPIPTPVSKIKIENSYRILRSYPDEEVPQTGIIDLEDVTEIADSVFINSKKIKEISGKSLQKIGAVAFKGSALQKLTLGAKIPQVADNTFEGTNEDKSLIVPQDVVETFYLFAHKNGFKTINGTALPQVVVKDGALTSYPDYLLTESVQLGQEVTAIGASVFEGKSVIKEVHALGVKKIGAGAFKGATSLATVELGTTVPEVAEDAFEGTPQDKNLVVASDDALKLYKDFATKHGFKTINGKEVYPIPYGVTIEGTVLKKVSSDVQRETLELPPYVTTIGYGALQNRPAIKHIIGAGVIEIAENAFKNMSKLVSADFPKLKKIGRTAFENTGLKTIHAPQVEEIALGAFKSSSALQEINFPLLKVIPQDAFRARWDGALKKIVLPSAVSIDDNAFLTHAKIESIELGTTPPTTVSPQAFDNALKNGSPKLIVPASAVSAYGKIGDKWKGIFVIEAKQ